MNEILKVENLSKSFGTKKVLRDFGLSLERGKVYGLLGNNGEGKTTLIRILQGIIPADRGLILYQGKPVKFSGSAYKRSVGYIAEDNIFFNRMTVRELLRFNAGFYPAWNGKKAEEYLTRFALNPKDKIRNLSRGMKLKLGLIAALASEPELLLLDDPTSGLDVPTRHDFLRNIIREITDAGMTVLFASHLVHELERVIDRLAILHGGKLILDVDYEDFRDRIKKVTLICSPEELDKVKVEGILAKDVSPNGCELVIYPWDEIKEKALAEACRAPLETSALSLEDIFVSFVGRS